MRRESPWRSVVIALGLVFGLTAGIMIAERRAVMSRPTRVGPVSEIDDPEAAPAQPTVPEPQGFPVSGDGSSPSGVPHAAAEVPVRALPEVLVDPSITVRKALRDITLYSDGEAVAHFAVISLGHDAYGAKREASDGRTPEGRYYVCAKGEHNGLPFVQISYPGEPDADAGLDRGVISRRDHRAILTATRAMIPPPEKTSLGGGIVIGAEGGAWQDGSVVASAAAVSTLAAALPLGAEIVLEP